MYLSKVYFYPDFSNFNYFYFFDVIIISNTIGQALYNYYNIIFLILGLILLTAVIGPISLTFTFSNKQKHEFEFKQLSRSANSLIYFRNIL